MMEHGTMLMNEPDVHFGTERKTGPVILDLKNISLSVSAFTPPNDKDRKSVV